LKIYIFGIFKLLENMYHTTRTNTKR